MSASLIITTYCWPQALHLILESVLRQSVSPFEIIVADDGSGPDTARTVQTVLAPSAFRWCHVRHDDLGIRQARIKNLGVRYSQGSYLIFTDHDVVLHPDFVADHLSAAKRGLFLQGKRSFLAANRTEKILTSGVFILPFPFSPDLRNRKNSLRSPKFGRLISRLRKFQTTLRGCNLSVHRDDFLAVDGYDETFDGLWGREDSDICYRLFHCGVKCRNLWFSALQYHLHHEVTKREYPDRLDNQLLQNRNQKRKKALKGFSQLSFEGEVIACSNGF